MSRSPVIHFAGRLGLTVFLSLLVTVVNYSLPARGSAATAVKATTINITDVAGDESQAIGRDGSTFAMLPELDILSASVVQDRPNKVVRATVTMSGPSTGVNAQLRVALGFTDVDGNCGIATYAGGGQADAALGPVWVMNGALHLETMVDDEPIPGPQAAPTPTSAFYLLGAPAPLTAPISKTTAAATVTLTTPASLYFGSRGWNCAVVQVEQKSADGQRSVIDGARGFAPDDPSAPPAAAPPPIGNATATILDADGDGIPDSTDVCPQVAGAGTNGCLTTPISRSVVLGTKRVVFDRLLARTGTKCPAAVKATAVLKGHTVGTGQIGVLAHSKWCQVRGVLRLKKNVKKARVTVKGGGVATLAMVVAK